MSTNSNALRPNWLPNCVYMLYLHIFIYKRIICALFVQTVFYFIYNFFPVSMYAVCYYYIKEIQHFFNVLLNTSYCCNIK